MNEAGRLRPMSRAALIAPTDLADHTPGDLLVLTLPEGGLELHETPQDEVVLWAYSKIDKLVESCGDGQPYVSTTSAELARYADSIEPLALVALDVWHPEGRRYPEPDVREQEPIEPLNYEQPDTSVVWIPTRPVRTGDRRVDVELHCLKPGEPLLLAYSSLDSLRANCGPHQAASAITADSIVEVARQAGASGVVFDAVLAEEARYDAPVVDWTRDNHFGLGSTR